MIDLILGRNSSGARSSQSCQDTIQSDILDVRSRITHRLLFWWYATLLYTECILLYSVHNTYSVLCTSMDTNTQSEPKLKPRDLMDRSAFWSSPLCSLSSVCTLVQGIRLTTVDQYSRVSIHARVSFGAVRSTTCIRVQ